MTLYLVLIYSEGNRIMQYAVMYQWHEWWTFSRMTCQHLHHIVRYKHNLFPHSTLCDNTLCRGRHTMGRRRRSLKHYLWAVHVAHDKFCHMHLSGFISVDSYIVVCFNPLIKSYRHLKHLPKGTVFTKHYNRPATFCICLVENLFVFLWQSNCCFIIWIAFDYLLSDMYFLSL